MSEGNFLNDPFEGLELFNFLDHDKSLSLSSSENISVHKPFIGSFVTYLNKDDLNMWRFYGKDDGIDAKGCSISINNSKFLYDLIDSIDVDDEGYNSLRDDINFYYVAYYDPNSRKFILSDNEKCEELNMLLSDLSEFIKVYPKFNDNQKLIARKDLISIAYLFKNIIYSNEQEIRILTEGRKFKNEYSISSPPKVFIELLPLKDYIINITFGPKSSNFIEWKTSINYAYNHNPPQY